jgi:DNA-directed RNA polymerase specialized sigma24 family protein
MSSASTDGDLRSSRPLGLSDLLGAHYANVYRLARASLENDQAARQAARQAFAEAWLDYQRHPAAHPEQDLYAQALKRLPRHKPGEPSALPAPGASQGDASWLLDPAVVQFNRAVDRLGTLEHRMLVLVAVLGWRPEQAAALLGVSAGAARAQVNLFRKSLYPLLEKAPKSIFPPAASPAALPGEPAADRRAAAVLQARWPAPALDETALEALAREVEALAESLRQRRAKTAPYRGLTLALSAAAVLLLCLTAGLGLWLFNPLGLGGAAVAYATPTADGAPTAFPPVTPVAALNRRSSDEEIRQRWQESPDLWHSLSADLQTWRYGPLSYSGLPRAYRSQAWVLQPEQSILLNGLLGAEPGESYLVAQDRAFWRSAAANQSHSQPWDGELESLLLEGPLRQMVFPATSPWASRPGSFRSVQTSEQAGRKAVVFDWLNPDGQREARLWLDSQTGIILRAQVFGGDDFKTLIDESVITALALERSEPPPALIVAARLDQAQPTSGDPAFAALLPTPTPAIVTLDRPAALSDPAPPGFDPSGGRLAFTFPRDPQVANAARDTAAQPVELIADGYSLGMTRFGLPWMLRCDRSPDGRRLAFNTASDGAAPADDSLRWFNLSNPSAIYQPLPELQAASFAFAPDSRRLAVAGQASGDLASGVYLVDIATGESRLLLAAEDARSLLWSPDGEFLALVGRLPNQEQPASLVLHVRTRQIAYQGEPGMIGETPADSPIAAWGVPFPVEMGGMDACAAPQPGK